MENVKSLPNYDGFKKELSEVLRKYHMCIDAKIVNDFGHIGPCARIYAEHGDLNECIILPCDTALDAAHVGAMRVEKIY